MRPPVWLVDGVVALYPERVRDRYGPEIADLLGGSPRPWRDLGDVAWNATLDRAGSVRIGQLRPHTGQMVALVTFPAVFWIAMLVLMPVTVTVAGGVGALVGQGYVRFSADNGIEIDSSDGAFAVGMTVNVAIVAVFASLNARRWLDSVAVPAPAFLVPTLLGLGCLGAAFLPPTFVVVLSGRGWVALPATMACWWLAVVALGARFRVLIGCGRTVAARRLVVAGTVAVLALTCAVHLATAAVPLEVGPMWAFLGPMSLPSLIAVCTPFTFAILAAVTPRVRT